MKAVLFYLFSLYILTHSAKFECNLPPSELCRTWDNAKACQMEEQCLKYYSRVNTKKTDNPKVQLELYYESLCSGCSSFLTTQLFPTWLMLQDIMNVTLVPYGNAAMIQCVFNTLHHIFYTTTSVGHHEEKNESGKLEFVCQHGPEECLDNMIEACLMYFLKDVNDNFPVIHCLEYSVNVTMALDACLTLHQPTLSSKKVLECVNSDLGKKLMHQNALRTDSLKPPHKFVPWIVFNGEHTDDLQNRAQTALFNLVCKTYTGPMPDACSQKKNGISLRKNLLCLK